MRATYISRLALPSSRPRTTAIAALIARPAFQSPARVIASTITLATMPKVTRTPSQSLYHGVLAVASISVRSTCSGEMLRTPTSGRIANESATHTPTPSPDRIAVGESVTDTSTGSMSRTSAGNASWIATPRIAPAVAPANPIIAA